MDRASLRTRLCLSSFAAALAVVFTSPLPAAPPKGGATTHPIPKVWPCVGQTKRAADHTITMVANQQDYIATVVMDARCGSRFINVSRTRSRRRSFR